MNLTDLYKIAKEHKNTHKHCGAEPYLDYNFLFNFLQKEKMNNNLDNILELGSGVGFTAIVINLATPFSLIDSVENNQEHVDFAKKWIKDLKLNLHEVAPSVNNINIIQADVHTVLPYLESNKYDLIFFDVYAYWLYLLAHL
jgi:tRNA1(Val) A37 N6-methylase TrmN6